MTRERDKKEEKNGWIKDLVSPETKHKLLKNKIDKYMHLGIITL